MKKLITKEEKENLIQDIKSGKFNSTELMTKYGYPSVSSLNGTIFWWKKQGILTTTTNVVSPKIQKKRVKNPRNVRFSISQKIEIYEKYDSNLYSNEEIAKMYNLPNRGAVSSLLSRFRKSKHFSKLDFKNTPNIPIAEKVIVTPKGEINTVRTINFPDGFKIQIEKQFISGVLIHENGNITIIK
jgi:hypothetical protein